MSSSSTCLYFYTYYKISEWQSCSVLSVVFKSSRLSRCQSLISHICIFCIINSDKMVWKHTFFFFFLVRKMPSRCGFESHQYYEPRTCAELHSLQFSPKGAFSSEWERQNFFFVNYCLKWWFFSPWRLNWKWNDNNHAKSLLNRLRLANLRPLIKNLYH